MNQHFDILIKYRFEQADESIKSAQIMLDQKLNRPSVNRSYYAMFYAVLALLIRKQIGSSKHSGVISLFDREYIHPGKVSKDYSTWLHRSFKLRLEADYKEMVNITDEEAKTVLDHAITFVKKMKEIA